MTDKHTHRPTTVTLAAHARRGLIILKTHIFLGHPQDAGQDVNTMDTSLVEEMERLRRENQELQKEIKNQKMIVSQPVDCMVVFCRLRGI